MPPTKLKRQRNQVQTKIPQTEERDLSETEFINLPEMGFKIKIINMLMELQKNIQEIREEIRNEIQMLKNTECEMKPTMKGSKSILEWCQRGPGEACVSPQQQQLNSLGVAHALRWQ